MKEYLLPVAALGIALLLIILLADYGHGLRASAAGTATVFKEAKLVIEHNATDEDTGFQLFADSEGWNKLTVTGPGGKVLSINGQGKFATLGLTELFLETVEPENADTSIEDLLSLMPAGTYRFSGMGMENGEKTGTVKGTALLTHNIPAGPELLSPSEDAEVSSDETLVVDWEPVTQTILGEPVTIIAYQLIIEKDEDPHPHMIGKFGLSMYLPSSVTKVHIPAEVLEPDTEYDWEVLAIEESGNQTLSSSHFSTE